MITKKNPRRYEVSLWTLQDSFITVLKSFNLDNFGTIEEPNLNLSDDSEDTFSFRLPMYIKVDGEYKENPIWYNVTNGNLIINLRKIKVVFHKGEPRQKVFEFVITKITESHDGFEKYCEVECEGLAYNDLGKTGYTINLSQELYELDCENGIEQQDDDLILQQDNDNNYYIELSQQSVQVNDLLIQSGNEIITPSKIVYDDNNYKVKVYFDEDAGYESYSASYKYEPIDNINYWLDKVLPPTYNWSYRIKMNWDNYCNEERQEDKIYEDAFIENWAFNDNDELEPTNVVNSKEKLRIITESESNRYNLTQTIAETFGVYCRYIYEYDENLHITNRIVEFYNNALQEDEEIIDFTYYYDTEDITREMDSADQVSKMFVISNGDESLLTDSITTIDANKSLEEYLLNFDYLYETGGIDDEQKEYIDEFETEMRRYNLQLRDLANKITVCQNALNDKEGFKVKRDNAKLMAQQAAEAAEDQYAHLQNIKKADQIDYDNNPDTLSMTGLNPDCCVLKENEDGIQSCKLHKDGIIANSILVFTTMEAATKYHRTLYGSDKETQSKVNIESITEDDSTTYIVTAYIDDEETTLGNYDNYAAAQDAANTWICENVLDDGEYLSNSNYQVEIDSESGFATSLNYIKYEADENRVLYIIYNYNLQLYYENLMNQWQNAQAKYEQMYEDYSEVVNIIDGERDENDEWISDDHGLLQDYIDEYNALLKEKEEKILEFENYLGPALREGNWQPDDNYAKYGDKRQINLILDEDSLFTEDGVSIGWDRSLFAVETKNYDEIGVNREKQYYPCIILTQQLQEELYNALIDEDEDISIGDIGFIWDDTVPPGINDFYDSEEVSDEEIQRLHDKWAEKRDELEQLDTISIEDKQILDQLWYDWRMALNSKRPEIKYPQIYRLGSELELAFLQDKDDDTAAPIPVIMFINPNSYCNTYNIVNQIEASQTDVFKSLNGKIGTLEVVEKKDEMGMKYVVNIISSSIEWINDEDLENYVRVYPRIRIPYSNFVENNDDCKIYIKNDVQLDPYGDYTIMSKYDINNGEDTSDLIFWREYEEIDSAIYSYYITINPEVMIRNNFRFGEYKLAYKLSNTALAIYLDAIEVLKENSIPKVSYTMTPIFLKSFFMEELYNWMHRIININDPELKFENVQGYISSITLNLDTPWEDTFEVINYTTKFEDLFSSIVASTAQIQKNSATISVVSQAFSSTGELTVSTLSESISSADGLNLKINDNFIIDNRGITAKSEDGAVYYTNKGIFTATDKDENGNWNWNSGITPTGINAKIITAGQLDTNLIHIYSGDDLRFQINSDGLFAYKSWLNEDISKLAISDKQQAIEEINTKDGMDISQYLVVNSDGLFLIAKEGACIFDRDNDSYEIVNEDVKRVEISWDGLILRNNDNKETFYADPDTGNLNIVGNIQIEGDNISAELSESKLRFGAFELVKTDVNNSECLSFVYESRGE